MPSVPHSKRGLTGVILLLSACLPLSGQAMPLAQAVMAGLSINPKVRLALAEAERAGIEVSMSKSGYLPSLTVSAGPELSRMAQPGYDITASQMLYDWGRVASEVESANATHRKYLHALLVAQDDSALNIIEIYLDVLASRERIKTVKAHIHALNDIEQLTTVRDAQGYSDRSELERTRLELSRAQEQLAIEEGSLQEADEQYHILVGQPARDLIMPHPPSLKKSLASKDLNQVIDNSPLLKKAKAEVDVSKAALQKTKAALLPQLNLEATALRRETGGRMDNDTVVSLRFRMDTLQGLSNFQRPLAAARQLEASQWQRDTTHRDIRRQLQTLLDNTNTLKTRIKSLTQQMKTAHEVIELYKTQFEVGHRDVIDLLNVQREQFEVERQLINSQIEQKRLNYRAAAQIGFLPHLLEENRKDGNIKHMDRSLSRFVEEK
ncbi:TolC family protein [Enterobacteriaceae bacterium RIT693]|nr:TolC family protein [Enterobacteriaceae bacterium RIT693]